MGRLMDAGLRAIGIDSRVVASPEEALALVAGEDFDVVVTDLNMPGMNGLELCERIVAKRPDVPVIVITALRQPRGGDRRHPRRRLRLHQPSRSSSRRCCSPLERALQHAGSRDEVKRLRERGVAGAASRASSAQSAPMRSVFDLVGARRRPDASVLHHRRERHRQGAGGARAARSAAAAHAGRSSPSTARRCPSRCSRASSSATRAAPSPTRAASRAGLFVQASGGTLFLDEIGEMPLGCSRSCCARCRSASCARSAATTRCRSTCASSRPPTATSRRAVEDGRFREDLFYPHQRHPHRAAAAARARRRRAAAGAAVPRRASRARTASRSSGCSPRRRRSASSPTPGRATCASCRTASSARWRSRASTEITVDDLPEKIREYRTLARARRPATIRRAAAARRGRAALHPARAGGGAAATRRWRRASSASTARRSTASSSATATLTTPTARRSERHHPRCAQNLAGHCAVRAAVA